MKGAANSTHDTCPARAVVEERRPMPPRPGAAALAAGASSEQKRLIAQQAKGWVTIGGGHVLIAGTGGGGGGRGGGRKGGGGAGGMGETSLASEKFIPHDHSTTIRSKTARSGYGLTPERPALHNDHQALRRRRGW